jgi:ADP-glucose pyrophosphorylase
VSTFHFHEIIRRLIPRRSAYGYTFTGEWYYTRTLDEYFEFHQSLLGPSPGINLTEWKTRSNTLYRLPAPTRCRPGAVMENSLIAGGCEIAGTVRNSVLSPGVSREMPQSLTCGATLVGMDVRIPAKARIGRNCIIHPESGEECFKKPVASGESVYPRAAEK